MTYFFGHVGRLIRGLYNDINPATLTGAIDVVIVQQDDGTYCCSPFHVRFGKLGVLRAREKVVDIIINGKPVDLHMKLGEAGEAFFVQELEEPAEVPLYLATSPIPSSEELMKQGIQELRLQSNISEANEEKPKCRELEHVRNLKSESSQDEGTSESEEAEKTKRRRKKRNMRRKPCLKSPKLVEEKKKEFGVRKEEIFEIDDVSTDEEEVAAENNKPSVSSVLPLPEEDKMDRTNSWARTHKYNENDYLKTQSDTEFKPISSSDEYPSSPKSDTEVEKQHRDTVSQDLLPENTTWEWGDLPKGLIVEEPKESETKQDSKQTDLGKKSKILSFIKSKPPNMKPEQEGIYLEEIEQLDDPEIAKYFPKNRFESIKDKEEDSESGRGASLPQSPHSVEGAVCGPPVNFLESEVKHLGEVSMSLCGGLPSGVSLDKFMQKVQTFEDLCENPNIFTNPDLVVRIHNNYYNWQTAAPIILSLVSFHKLLPQSTVEILVKESLSKKKHEKKKSGMSSWFPWGRAVKDTSDEASGQVPSGIMESEMKTEPINMSPVSGSSYQSSRLKDDEMFSSDAETDISEKDLNTFHKVVPKRADEGSSSQPIQMSDILKPTKEKFKKIIRLTSEEIRKLNLNEGANEISFSVTTQFQGTTRCVSHIYLWRYDDKIVVSDIDGTITKSDVLGQILPILGRDWSQSGVAQLFTRIHDNSYKFVYLSARAIGQSRITKDLLKNIKQGNLVLPDGPLLLSPTSLISAFHREVIEKKPEEFKIHCLKDIAALFPTNPFYAGFGNKINTLTLVIYQTKGEKGPEIVAGLLLKAPRCGGNVWPTGGREHEETFVKVDVYAYKAINIPASRIFTINHKGQLRHEFIHTFQTTYTKLSDIVDHFFPPIYRTSQGLKNSNREFGNLLYWKTPFPNISNSDLTKLEETKDEKR